MSLFPKFNLRKKKTKEINPSSVDAQVQESLLPYMTKAEFDKYMRKIERDKEKRKIWNSLTPRQQIRILRYIKEKKGGKNGKT